MGVSAQQLRQGNSRDPGCIHRGRATAFPVAYQGPIAPSRAVVDKVAYHLQVGSIFAREVPFTAHEDTFNFQCP